MGCSSGFTARPTWAGLAGITGIATCESGTALQQHVTHVADRLGRVQTLGADVHAVHDAAATEHTERIVQRGQTLGGLGVTAVGQEAIGLQQCSGTCLLYTSPSPRD